jgi:hypothetical protein
MKRNYYPILITLLLICWQLPAQQNQDSKKNNIVEVLSTPDSITHAEVNFHQDKRIEALLANNKNSNQTTENGFRVQVFSSNVQRTAKNNAFNIEKQIQEVFPEQSIYVNYTSPFWKVRVGDFKTKNEAQTFRNQLIESFPDFKSEIYIVPEKILVTSSK